MKKKTNKKLLLVSYKSIQLKLVQCTDVKGIEFNLIYIKKNKF